MQVPFSQDESRVWSQKTKLQLGKIQMPHRGAIRIVFLVACQHAIPTASDSAAPGKSQLRRMPVTLQIGVDIASIPRRLLGADNGAYLFQLRRVYDASVCVRLS